MPEPLIPDDVRALYEELIDEGGRIIPGDDPLWQDPRVRGLLESGLAIIVALDPPLLLPVGPDAAFARVVARWQRAMDSRRRSFGNSQATAVTLLRLALRAPGGDNTRRSCLKVVGKNQVTAMYDALACSAEKRVRACITGPYAEARFLPTGAAHRTKSTYLPPERDFHAHGGRSTILCDQDHVSSRPNDVFSGYADGEEIRVVQQKLSMKLLTVDDHTALIPLAPYGHPCLLIRDARLVTTFATFFELKWAQGEPWAPPGTPTATKDDTQRQRILDALAAGLKDEAIARQQDISVRTVRRHITALMQELGASTRFAAGVAAVRRGWVTRMAATS